MEFFTGGPPRLATLIDVYRKRNRENEERIFLEFAVPIVPEIYSVLPHNVKAAFDYISNLSNAAIRTEISAEIEGTRIQIYELPEHHKKGIIGASVQKCTIRGLKVSRPAKDTDHISEGDVHLSFSTTVLWDKGTWAFAGRLFDKGVFLVFSEGQMRLLSDDEEDEDRPDGKAAAANDREPDPMLPIATPEQQAEFKQIPVTTKSKISTPAPGRRAN
jgi:hypothetical protein